MFKAFLIFVFLVVVTECFRRVFRSLRRIEKRLNKLETAEPEIPSASSVEFYQLIDGEYRKVDHMFVKVDGEAKAKVAFKDSKGNAAQVEGAPQWALSDASLATLEVSEDGLSCKVLPAGPLGACKLQVKADADLGEGVKEILGEADLEFIAGEAVAVEISFE